MSGNTEKDYGALLKNVKDCDIDPEGKTFKYILIRAVPKNLEETAPNYVTKTLVRGYGRCEYHADILEEMGNKERLHIKGFALDCIGGGRIRHEKNKLHIYGYSQGFGKADHSLTKSLLEKSYPSYEITWSDGGY